MFDTIGIDWGELRCGVALGDSFSFLVIPHQEQLNTSDIKLLLSELVQKNKINKIVVGYPTNVLGGKTRVTFLVDTFITLIKDHFNIPVVTQDERFSTKDALKQIALDYSFSNKKQQLAQKHNLNHLSAAKVLERYFEHQTQK